MNRRELRTLKRKAGPTTAKARRSEFWRELNYEKSVMNTKGDPFKKEK